MLYYKLTCVFAVVLIGTCAGCGSAPRVVERDTVGARQAIINDHETVAEQRRQEVASRQEAEMQAALSQMASEEQTELADLEQQLKSDFQPQREEAEATLSDEELQNRLQEIQDEYQRSLEEGTDRIRTAYGEKREQVTTELAQEHQQELDELGLELDSQLRQALDEYDKTQQRAAWAAREEEEAAKEETAREEAAREEAAQPTPAAAQPFEERPAPTPAAVPEYTTAPSEALGTKAPVAPVVVPEAPVRAEDQPLRREGDAPLGQRRYYVNKYFRTGEALQKIEPSADLLKREHHEIVITFWMEGTERKGTPHFMLNGVPVQTWQDLEAGLAQFRKGLIDEHYILYPKVILDQRRDVPRSVADDVLSVCFKVGIRHISMGSREPLMEQ